MDLGKIEAHLRLYLSLEIQTGETLFLGFVDWQKAFDKVDQQKWWKQWRDFAFLRKCLTS